ncbi:MAG: hypothetical protein ABII97_01580 [Patescibacteria group bacterium]
MLKRENEKENIRKIQFSNGSYLVSLPIDVVRLLQWQERQKVVIKKSGKKIIIEDWEK